jgi:hypothetical protein
MIVRNPNKYFMPLGGGKGKHIPYQTGFTGHFFSLEAKG